MKLHRIWAIILRHLYLLRHSLDRQINIFYWPVIDLALWGLTGAYFASLAPEGVDIVLLFVSGIVFWTITYRGQFAISVNILEEIWNRNLVNLFTAPLKFSEWLSSLIVLGIFKGFASGIVGVIVAYALYQVNVLEVGVYFLIFAGLLLMSSWAIGFLISGVIVRLGTTVQAFSWALIFIIAPFSGIYYPVSVLPDWAQVISAFLPTSYVFESARDIFFEGAIVPEKLLISLVLNIVYIVLSLIFLRNSFKHVLREKGLVKIF